jgi:outer membrane protein assembly factor BamD (BamD/ComL family)
MKLFTYRLIFLVALVGLLWAPRCIADELVVQEANREMLIARFYMSQHDYTAAINRLKGVVTRYPASPLVEEALALLAKSYLALVSEAPSGETSRRQFMASEAQTSVAVLDRKFPTSHFSIEAHDALKSAGVDLVENEKSWISRALE